MALFPTLYPSRLASPSVESSCVQGDVGVGVKLALLLHITFTFLWETVTWEKMQHQGNVCIPFWCNPATQPSQRLCCSGVPAKHMALGADFPPR